MVEGPMLIAVASSNIFRREYASYLLGEAGYTIGEARSVEELMLTLGTTLPALILLDQQLDRADPSSTLRTLRLLSDSPVLWIAGPTAGDALLALEHHPAGLIGWPFHGAELLASIAALIERAGAEHLATTPRERYASHGG